MNLLGRLGSLKVRQVTWQQLYLVPQLNCAGQTCPQSCFALPWFDSVLLRVPGLLRCSLAGSDSSEITANYSSLY